MICFVLSGVCIVSVLDKREKLGRVNATKSADYLVTLYLVATATTIFERLHAQHVEFLLVRHLSQTRDHA